MSMYIVTSVHKNCDNEIEMMQPIVFETLSEGVDYIEETINSNGFKLKNIKHSIKHYSHSKDEGSFAFFNMISNYAETYNYEYGHSIIFKIYRAEIDLNVDVKVNLEIF
uniref:Uncharacterized protein n=1 Tax=Siphoviridae sp. ctZHD14 TaxID=2827891 RepID=A0A8S5SWW9_9CAUD|nr:MAG TPA: hypothetical protein [Siphoviridae sp. ctZHD14]